ncbi:hypothetical protein [Pontibacter populi]|uniref:hypothetical protein n=1 Tax=Pontibacter populi TaxID=890055 RepID=UPI001C5BA8CA|nr:hypothetical protein [Pontibacter populi]
MKDEKAKAIAESENIRYKVGLQSIGNDWKLDSTFKFLSIHPNFIIVDRKLQNTADQAIFYIADYLSNKNGDERKVVYLRNENGNARVVKEEDSFVTEYNNTGKVILNFTYNYDLKEKSFCVDSLPSIELVELNQAEFERMIKGAKEIDAEICGTAADEILTKGFPKKHTFIQEDEFKMRLKIL